MVKVKWAEVKYDVDQQTWYIAQVRIKDDAPEVRDTISTDDDRSSSDLVLRFAESAVAMLKVLIRERLADSVVETGTDELNRQKVEWGFSLKNESEFSGIGLDGIANLFHRYIVRYIMWQWCKLFMADQAAAWEKEYKECGDTITETLYMLGVPQKRQRVVNDTITIN